MSRQRMFSAVVTIGALLLVGVTGCSSGKGTEVMEAKDGAGMTLPEIEALSLEAEYELLGQRNARMQELMTPAQEAISTGPWIWGTGAAGLSSGVSQFDSLPGATNDNSFHLEMTRILPVEGEPGGQQDAEKMAIYFESQGFKIERSYTNDEEFEYSRYAVIARTDDGYWFRYWVQSTGYNALVLYSSPFWTEDYREIRNAIMHRIPKDGFFPYGEETVPGVYVEFPKWSDPELWSLE